MGGCLLLLTSGLAASPSQDKAGNHARVLNVQGFYRHFLVHLPPAYVSGNPLPLVIVFHGAGGDGQEALERLGWAGKADTEGFLVAAPDALPLHPDDPPDEKNLPLWGESEDTSVFSKAEVEGDLPFVRAMLHDIETHYAVDPRRIYAAGFSNGGGLVFRLGAEMPEPFAALASVAGLFNLPNAHPSRPVPLLLIIGMNDPVFPYNGGAVTVGGDKMVRPPVLDAVAQWAEIESFSSHPWRLAPDASLTSGRESRDLFNVFGPGGLNEPPVSSAVQTDVYAVAGMGHVWPGAVPSYDPQGEPVGRLRAVDMIWNFFRRYSLPYQMPDLPKEKKRVERPNFPPRVS